jgi:hypothetical protein
MYTFINTLTENPPPPKGGVNLTGCPRVAKSLFLKTFPLFFQGEGDQGGEVDKNSQYS